MNNMLDKLTGWIKLKYYQNYLAKNHKYRLINCFGNAMKMISKTLHEFLQFSIRSHFNLSHFLLNNASKFIF